MRNNRLKRGVPLYFHYYKFSILFNIFWGFKNQKVLKKIKKLGIIEYFVCLKEFVGLSPTSHQLLKCGHHFSSFGLTGNQ